MTRAERSPGSAPRSLPQLPAGARRRRFGLQGRNRPELRRYTMGSGACHTFFPRGAGRAAGSDVLDLDLDVDAGGQVEALKGVDGLRSVLHDVDEPLVHLHLEVLAAVFVLVGGADDRVA